MKKLKFGLVPLFVGFAILGSYSLAQSENNELLDSVEDSNQKYADVLQKTLEFQQFSSCQDMDEVLGDFIKKFENWGHNYPMPMLMKGGAMDDMVYSEVAEESVGATDSARSATVDSSSNEFSTTNLQKIGVDEPEIIKTNGKNIFYYNQQEQKIYIMKSPLDVKSSTITLDNAEVLSLINLPDSLYNIQLFLTEDKLVILASRYYNFRKTNGFLNRGERTSVAIYDISNPDDVKLEKFTDLDGYYRNARMLDGKLYILSEMSVNRRGIYQAIEDKKSIDFSELTPKAIDVSPETQKATVSGPSCENISYIFPSDDTIEEMNLNPVFTVISVIDVESPSKKTATNVLLANAGEIHMSQESLYIAQNIWFSVPWACPMGARCIMPRWDDGQYTLLHKFDVDGMSIDYQNSNIIPGSLLNQYSMDEDSEGNFRILTSKNWSEGTNFFAFDDSLTLRGKITEIEPEEQFKASRYIGDKLYLVTFEQTDPLFVIDIADIENPKIIGELKIPGFSTYLHPFGDLENNKQYLIGLGYKANDKGWQEGLQLSLYEVAYDQNETEESRCGRLKASGLDSDYSDCISKVSSENIRVSQLDTISYGGRGSFSEAMENPRMFVMDSQGNVSLPMVLQDEISNGERCDTYKDSNGAVVSSNCYPVIKQETSFAGLKTVNFDKNSGKISEKFSVDYFDIFEKLYKSDYEYYNMEYRQIQNTQMRVGFAGDLMYMVNNDFAHFVLPITNDGKYLYFDENLE